MPGTGSRANLHPVASLAGSPLALAAADHRLLLDLQRQALQYFLDNQTPAGLVLDRQSNHGAPRHDHPCSLAATGMGFIALALGTAPPYRLLSRSCAVSRIDTALGTALDGLARDAGILPHFVDPRTHRAIGHDAFSTIDTAWLLAGALWAAEFLEDGRLAERARRLYDRVDWAGWSCPATGLMRHGKRGDGRLLECTWDRLNGETCFLYVLAAGAEEGRALRGGAWCSLRSFPGEAGGLCFQHADLGLFVFQYGLDLLDGRRWQAPDGTDLAEQARLATLANERVCRDQAHRFRTYRHFWGLSAGDGPGPGEDVYRTYSPSHALDGTAHLTAALASLAHHPEAVLAQLHEADRCTGPSLRGRYGFSNVNLDHGWVSRDVLGIDLGAAVLALDNCLSGQRIRAVFHALECVRRGLKRFGFRDVLGDEPASSLRQAG
jgi:hypothetical protein